MNEELDAAAAEYVLGTLPADERARFAARLSGDAEARTAMRWWRDRLAALDATAAPAIPPASLWQAIERAAMGRTADSSEPVVGGDVVQLRRRVALWRGAALTAGALAAGLAGFVVLDRQSAPVAAGARYMAVVDTDGREPALIAEVDTRTGVIRVRSLAAQTPAGSSLELWHIPEGRQPRSLGLVSVGATPQVIDNAAAGAGPVDGLIAVTVEPEGGSTTGGPTGPVVYSGRLIPVE